MTSAEIEDLSRSLQSMTPAIKLRLAAKAMERGRPDIAIAVARAVVADYDAAQLAEEQWRQAG